MEIEPVQGKLHLSKDEGSSDLKLQDSDLKSLTATLKQSFKWKNGKLDALILLKSPSKHIVLAAVHQGTEIESFQSDSSISFQILEGKLGYHILKESVNLKKNESVTLDEHIKYRLTFQEDTVFLLTISNGLATTANDQSCF